MRNLLAIALIVLIAVAVPLGGVVAYSAVRFESADVHVSDWSYLHVTMRTHRYRTFEDALARENSLDTFQSLALRGRMTLRKVQYPEHELPPYHVEWSEPRQAGTNWEVWETTYTPVPDRRSGKVHPSDVLWRYFGYHPNYTNSFSQWLEKDMALLRVRLAWCVLGITIFVSLAGVRYCNLFGRSWQVICIHLWRLWTTVYRFSNSVDQAIDRANLEREEDRSCNKLPESQGQPHTMRADA